MRHVKSKTYVNNDIGLANWDNYQQMLEEALNTSRVFYKDVKMDVMWPLAMRSQ